MECGRTHGVFSGWARMVVLAVLAVAALLLGAAPADAGIMDLSSAIGLRHGQIITVNVSGFGQPDPGQLTLLECRPSARSSADCDPSTIDTLVTNGDGTGSAPFEAKLVPGLCDQSRPCAIFAVESPLRFDNAAPGSRYAAVAVSFTGTTPSTAPGSAVPPPPSAPAPAPPHPPRLPASSSPAPAPAPAQPSAEPPPSVPEVPWGALLPLAAAATFALTILVARARGAPAAAPGS